VDNQEDGCMFETPVKVILSRIVFQLSPAELLSLISARVVQYSQPVSMTGSGDGTTQASASLLDDESQPYDPTTASSLAPLQLPNQDPRKVREFVVASVVPNNWLQS
jgi:hypothetical protein